MTTTNGLEPFVLIKRNDAGIAYANIYLIASVNAKNIPQFVNIGSTIKFNKFSKLASIAWLTSDTLTMLKDGFFRVQFFIDYSFNTGPIQIALNVNGLQMVGTYGTVSNIVATGGQVNGEFNVKLKNGDSIQLVSVNQTFTISTNTVDQILAIITVTERQ